MPSLVQELVRKQVWLVFGTAPIRRMMMKVMHDKVAKTESFFTRGKPLENPLLSQLPN